MILTQQAMIKEVIKTEIATSPSTWKGDIISNSLLISFYGARSKGRFEVRFSQICISGMLFSSEDLALS